MNFKGIERPTLEHFGFVEVEDARHAEILVEFEARGRAADDTVLVNTLRGYERPIPIFENEDMFFVELTWIGSCGHLMPKEGQALMSMGSGVPAPLWIWGHYRGMQLGDKTSNVALTIHHVHDYEKTKEAMLACFHHKFVYRTLKRKLLANEPITIENVALWSRVDVLFKAESNSWFDFSFETIAGLEDGAQTQDS